MNEYGILESGDAQRVVDELGKGRLVVDNEDAGAPGGAKLSARGHPGRAVITRSCHVSSLASGPERNLPVC